ncbi:hypothetical protein STENM36S_01646 [Streptomyces tendae]
MEDALRRRRRPAPATDLPTTLPGTPSDCPADLPPRAARRGYRARRPRLTALFREARYSSHPMDASHRKAAADSLEAIAALLGDRDDDRDRDSGSAPRPNPEAG